MEKCLDARKLNGFLVVARWLLTGPTLPPIFWSLDMASLLLVHFKIENQSSS